MTTPPDNPSGRHLPAIGGGSNDPHDRSRLPWRIATAAALVVVVGAVAWAALRSDGPADASSPPSAESTVADEPTATTRTEADRPAGRAHVATPAPTQVDAQRPREITLPSGTSMAVDASATARDGELAIPTDIERAGWWDGSSRLGDPFGSVVIAAHIDSFSQGLGRFAELLDMHPGDVVRVQSADLRQDYRVVSAELVPKSSISRGSNLFSAAGDPRLVLITCGGAYDSSLGGYQDNMIVVAVPTGPLT